MKRISTLALCAATFAMFAVTACQMFDSSPTDVSQTAEGEPIADFIMGNPELDDWGAYYEEGDSFVRLDIPVAGALKIEYSTTRGWKGAIFIGTTTKIGVEIGLLTRDGVVDVIDSVLVSYVEGGTFSSLPPNIKKIVNKGWTQYKRMNADGSESHWWTSDAAFSFNGNVMTAYGVVNSKIQWTVIPGGAFEKPAPSASGGMCGGNYYKQSKGVTIAANDQYDIPGPGQAAQPYTGTQMSEVGQCFANLNLATPAHICIIQADGTVYEEDTPAGDTRWGMGTCPTTFYW